MSNLEFDSFVELKIRDIIAMIMEREGFEFETAINYLYKSRLYRALLNENTKLWHLSNVKLLQMLVNEKETRQLIYPDYV